MTKQTYIDKFWIEAIGEKKYESIKKHIDSDGFCDYHKVMEHPSKFLKDWDDDGDNFRPKSIGEYEKIAKKMTPMQALVVALQETRNEIASIPQDIATVASLSVMDKIIHNTKTLWLPVEKKHIRGVYRDGMTKAAELIEDDVMTSETIEKIDFAATYIDNTYQSRP